MSLKLKKNLGRLGALTRLGTTPNKGGGVLTGPFARYPAIRAARAYGQRAPIAMVGDSLTVGFGSHGAGGGGGGGAGGAANTRRSKSMCRQFSDLLNTNGIASRCDSFFAHVGTAQTLTELYDVYDQKVLFDNTVDWVLVTSSNNPSANTAGGFWVRNTTTVARMYFQPVVAADTFDIYFEYFATGGGDVYVDDTGGVSRLGIFNTVGASPAQMGKITVSRAAASTGNIRIFASAPGVRVGVFAIVPYNSAAPCVEIWNMGRGGWSAANWLANANYFSPANAMVQHAPKAYVTALGANDWGVSSTPAATFEANLQSIITLQKSVAQDVRLIKQHGTVVRDQLGYDQPSSYRTAIDNLVAANNLPPAIDFYNGAALVQATDYFDDIHLTQSGYGKEAALLLADALVEA